MKHLFWIIALFFPLMALAANEEKEWNDGALSWSDFKGRSMIPGVPSYIKTSLGIVTKQATIKGKTKMHLNAVAKIDKDRSFADSAMRTDQRLRYHQLQFDILESYRRDLQSDINTGMTGLEADERLKHYNNLYTASLDKLQEQSENGANDAKIQVWEYFIRKKLDEQGLPPEPEIITSPFSYGFYLGTGADLSQGNLGNAFTGSWTFTAGIGLGLSRFKFRSDITYGQPKIKESNIMAVEDQTTSDTYASYLAITASLGYSILDTKKFCITPHVGGMWSNYGWNVANYENVNGELKIKNYESPSISSFNWYAAIDFDYHFFTVVSKNPFFLTGKREQYTSSIRITPFVGRGVYKNTNPELRSCHIGFTIAYVGMARSLGFK
ncbi:MAG: hypothetical protein PHR45_03690 [Muribaculaceae bacterium]|nr:hypothetical protein [Muribaculaceae bacterium]